MTKLISDFVRRFGVVISLDDSLVVKKHDRYFLLGKRLTEHASEDFYYAGAYLGRVKEGKFIPSFLLLGMIAQEKSNKVFIGKKTEWLFICGRDIFKQGITKVAGLTKQNDYALVMNSFGECLGYGRILHSLGQEKRNLAIENLLDIGDFLRREK